MQRRPDSISVRRKSHSMFCSRQSRQLTEHTALPSVAFRAACALIVLAGFETRVRCSLTLCD